MAKAIVSSRCPRRKDLCKEPPFGRWTVKSFSRLDSRGKPYWNCVCECGNEKEIRGDSLTSGKSQSCGCLSPDVNRELNTTHGMSKAVEFRIWNGMIQRCTNEKSVGWKDYGGRGIKVCARWRESFEAFYADMGPRPSPRHSIDRYPNNDGDYEPTNCRWATQSEQNLNSRHTRLVTIDGITLPLKLWTERLGVDYHLVVNRIHEGWSEEKALKEPKFDGRLACDGETLTLGEWSARSGVDKDIIGQRICIGWDAHRAIYQPQRKRRTRAEMGHVPNPNS